jgi:hypothetical protein
VEFKGQCWRKQKEPLLMEASSIQKATCEPKQVNFSATKKYFWSLHYKNVKMAFL